ncbi:MAG TPA: efflux RND transporter periplasmic adaptor subunit [Phenylobacterium sp.]|nr:efflux RND transporter periplasmic adaptor subunit [Phenylobacterium sp.]
MRLKPAHIFAIGLAVVVVLYLTVGTLLSGGKKHAAPTQAAKTASIALASVQVAATPETQHPISVTVRGRTEAARSVIVKSETSGVVAATPAVEGSYVAKGTVLCRLNVDARQAGLDQARAALRSRQLTQQASIELAKKGYRSQTQVLQDQANLDNAQAGVRQAEIALEQTNIRAPFNGVFDKRDAEIGTYLSPGQSCGTLLELNPLLIVGDLPETETSKLHVGSAAVAKLVSGETLSGTVRYVAREADPQTRTYHVEVAVQNPRLIRSGLSATVQIASGVGPAHLVPVSSLVLDSAGRQGVRYVRDDNMVAFAPVSVIEETAGGVWVSGMRGVVRVITVGQSYVAEGQKVRVGAPG